MLTSRAEYRLLLRSDTSDARLTPEGHRLGLVSEERAEAVAAEGAAIERLVAALEAVWLGDNPRHAAALAREGIEPARRSMTGTELARRPGVPLDAVVRALDELGLWQGPVPDGLVRERAEIAIRYGAFIDKEEREAQRHRRSHTQSIDPELDYATVLGLRVEAMQKLSAARPVTIGQAMKTAGVTPSDVGALLVHLARKV
jgi:tRNA uridine 5-carboxymethylaminomethyl modification enzyme